MNNNSPFDTEDLDDLDFRPDENDGKDGLYEHYRIVVDAGQKPVRADKFLTERLTNTSRNRIQQAADAGFIFADGRPIKSSYKVKGGETITLMLDRPKYDNDITPEDRPTDIVY